jgi:hypothetical protein
LYVIFLLFLVGLIFELRAFCLPHLQSIFVQVILEMGVSQTICPGWPQTVILPKISLPSATSTQLKIFVSLSLIMIICICGRQRCFTLLCVFCSALNHA